MVGRVGIGLLLALALASMAAHWISPFDPGALVGPSLAPPGGAHPLGTNDVGQDIFSRLLHGGRVSLAVGFAVAIAATFLGTAVGLVSGYMRGPVDAVLMRIVDVVMALPFLPLLIVLQVFVGPGLGGLVAVLVLVMWARPARELRSRVLAAREQVHVQAARTMGASNLHVLRRYMLPDAIPLVIPQFVRILRAAILSEASLSFLGLGDPTVTTWGSMLFHAQARSAYLTGAWVWWILPPGLLIGVAVLGAALIGYSLEERSRPRLTGDWTPVEFPGTVQTGPTRVDGATTRGPAKVPGQRGAVDQGPVLQVQHLGADYGNPDIPAVNDVSLALERGEILGLVGESGSGKSTLAMCAMSLLRAPGTVRRGTVCVAGQDLSRFDSETMRRMRGAEIALVPQASQSALNPVRAAVDQVVEAIRVHGGTGPEVGLRAHGCSSRWGSQGSSTLRTPTS